MENARCFKILSIDGGGFRGAYPAYLLKRMEEAWRVDWRLQFDLFAGTSTGAIVAACLACGVPAARIYELYEKNGAAVFKKRWFAKLDPFGFTGLFASRYSRANLQAFLQRELGDTKLGEVKVPLLIPAVDIGNGQVHVFKSAYDPNFVRDSNVLVRDAVLASCAAPTYFDPFDVLPYRLCDGGLWANNPVLVAATDAKRRLGVPLADLRILSVGTGKSKTFYSPESGDLQEFFLKRWLGWGFASRWGRSKFIDLILNLQSDVAHNILSLLLQEDGSSSSQLLRLNFDSDCPLPMDKPGRLRDWVSRADKDFTYRATEIREFLDLNKPGE